MSASQDDRAAFARAVRDTGAQWISNESAALSQWQGPMPAVWGRFLLMLNGEGVAYAEPHGTALEWLA